MREPDVDRPLRPEAMPPGSHNPRPVQVVVAVIIAATVGSVALSMAMMRRHATPPRAHHCPHGERHTGHGHPMPSAFVR